jgi:thioredoxin 1
MPSGGATHVVSDANFDQEVLKSAEPVVVDFFAEWCGPCKAMAPALEQVAVELKGKVKIAKLDIDQSPVVAQRYKIQSVPTLMIFRDGEFLSSVVGQKNRRSLVDWIDNSLRSNLK